MGVIGEGTGALSISFRVEIQLEGDIVKCRSQKLYITQAMLIPAFLDQQFFHKVCTSK